MFLLSWSFGGLGGFVVLGLLGRDGRLGLGPGLGLGLGFRSSLRLHVCFRLGLCLVLVLVLVFVFVFVFGVRRRALRVAPAETRLTVYRRIRVIRGRLAASVN